MPRGQDTDPADEADQTAAEANSRCQNILGSSETGLVPDH
jgi:hypothetical protein